MNHKVKPSPHGPTPHKRRALAFLAAGLALLFVLATSLPSLTLWPGEPITFPPFLLNRTQVGKMPGDGIFLIILRIILALWVLALPVVLVWSLINKERRKRLLFYLIMLAALYWLLTSIVPQGGARQLDTMLPSVRPNAPQTSGSAPQVQPPAPVPSDTTVWIVTIVVVLLIVTCAIGLIWFIRKRQRPSPLQELATEAQGALNAIRAGGSLEENIERCYREMCTVLQRERNLERNANMTPSEFVQTLQGKGLSVAPFQQLTRLFEDLRYGGNRPGPREEQQAVQSLTAIVAACRGPSRATR